MWTLLAVPATQFRLGSQNEQVLTQQMFNSKCLRGVIEEKRDVN